MGTHSTPSSPTGCRRVQDASGVGEDARWHAHVAWARRMRMTTGTEQSPKMQGFSL